MKSAVEQAYLDSPQFQVLEVVRELESFHGKASTSDVAAYMSLSYRQTLRYLQGLEKKGYVLRIGQRAGWQSRYHDDLGGSEPPEITSRSANAERPDPLKLLPQYQMEKLPPVEEGCSCASHLKPLVDRRQA